jgi:hypothetical protein
MSVVAKFFVAAVEEYPHQSGGKVTMRAASRGARNAQWASATPSGEFTMQINNQPAFDFFDNMVAATKTGGPPPEVMITIVKAHDGMAGDGHRYEPADPALDGTYYGGKCAACSWAKDDTVKEYELGTSKVTSERPSHPNG